MKKFLPKIIAILFLLCVLLPKTAHAQNVTPTIGVTPTQPALQLQQPVQTSNGTWVPDPEVTFVGKNVARSGQLLNFTLRNHSWVCVREVPNSKGQCDNRNNPLATFWLRIVQYIVAPLIFIAVLATAIVIIVTRGRSLTIMRFLPRFIAMVLLIFLSFALVQFFYQFSDTIQGFFLRPPGSTASCPPTCIEQKHLLFFGWDYQTFNGLRRIGAEFDETVFITLLLTKLSALTYFVMIGILFFRKIILWLFIIVSPLFPLLLLFYPIRNTAKIWIGEFFRWLLYGPLFAIFLSGLVFMWQGSMPLVFSNPDIGVAGREIYPTAVNILLGGPGQKVAITNSVNLPETFGLYIVALLMLWGVIILPWILLQIFLDHAANFAGGDSAFMKNIINTINKRGPSPSRPPSSPMPGGTTLNLPFAKKFSMPPPPAAPTGMARQIPVSTSEVRPAQTAYMPAAQVKAQVLNMTNMSVPSIRDIAKYDTSTISKDKTSQQEISRIRENLTKIANPQSSTTTIERQRYTEIHEKLTRESQSGNILATSILNAANSVSKQSTTQIKDTLTQIANPAKSPAINKQKVASLNKTLLKAKQEGNKLATEILSVTDQTPSEEIEKLKERIMDAKEKGEPVATQVAEITEAEAKLPAVNRVQTVSKEDYQAVKDMWKENYHKLEVPEGMEGTRSEWVKDDIQNIDKIISELSSMDPNERNQGMQEVGGILPFLLVGGFSQSEIVSYLKAKLEAAKEVIEEIAKDDEEKIDVSTKKSETATQVMRATLPEVDEGTKKEDVGSTPLEPVIEKPEESLTQGGEIQPGVGPKDSEDSDKKS